MNRRLEIYNRSTIPSSLSMWNSLDISIRHSPSLSIFKRNLKDIFKQPAVPFLYLVGVRRFSVYHARLRNNCSNLNSDLFNNHVGDSPLCTHCNVIEDAEHFFFRCTLFIDQRLNLFRNTRPFHPLSTTKLLLGFDNLSEEENV